MKNIFFISLLMLLALTGSNTASAQNTDSLLLQKKLTDSVLNTIYKNYYQQDTQYREQLRKINKHRLMLQQDTLFHEQKRIFDSSQKKMLRGQYTADSIFRKKADAAARAWTLRSKTDSQQVKNGLLLKKKDSLNHLFLSTSSLYQQKLDLQLRLSDSLKKKLYQQHIKTDSLKLYRYLQYKKMLQLKMDTLKLFSGLHKKELKMEISCIEGDTIFISNSYKKVVIKNIPAQKIRLSSVILFKDPLQETDEQLFKKMGITLSKTGNRVMAVINAPELPAQNNTGKTNAAVLNEENNVSRILTIEVPGNAVIILNTKFADANIESYVKELKAQLLSGSLTMGSAGSAFIKGNYAVIKANAVNEAMCFLTASTLIADKINTLKVVSSSSALDLGSCTAINITSTNDDYKLQQAGSVAGSKDFGRIEIGSLREKLDLSGTGADIKVNGYSYHSPVIKIDSRYADVKLPLGKQENFAVYYEGSYKDVNKASSLTGKLTAYGKLNATLTLQKDTLTAVNTPLTINKTVLKAVAGNVTDKYARIDIICPFCNVVFN